MLIFPQADEGPKRLLRFPQLEGGRYEMGPRICQILNIVDAFPIIRRGLSESEAAGIGRRIQNDLLSHGGRETQASLNATSCLTSGVQLLGLPGFGSISKI